MFKKRMVLDTYASINSCLLEGQKSITLGKSRSCLWWAPCNWGWYNWRFWCRGYSINLKKVYTYYYCYCNLQWYICLYLAFPFFHFSRSFSREYEAIWIKLLHWIYALLSRHHSLVTLFHQNTYILVFSFAVNNLVNLNV